MRRFRRMARQEGIVAFLRAANASKPRTITQRLPAATGKRRAPEGLPEKLGDPTPERATRAKEAGASATQTKVPPFNSQILGPIQRFTQQLGPEVMMVLERLYEVGQKGEHSRGLTAGYDGIKVDSSRATYQHLSEAESQAHAHLLEAMATMPPELQRFARELVLENIGMEVNFTRGAEPRRSRSIPEIGSELSGESKDGRYASGAVVATLKIIAWCVQRELGVVKRKK